jgi:signal transduction histidine kinase
VSFRARLLLASLATLAIGMGSLLVVGNLLLANRVRAEASSVLRANADAQVSALEISPTGVTVRATANDDALDRRSWVLDDKRVVERPPAASSALDRAAVALGRRVERPIEVSGPRDTRLRAEPVFAPGTRLRVGAIVVAFSTASLERLQQLVLAGSLVLCAVMLIAGVLAIRNALNGALRPVARMTASAQAWSAHDLDRRFSLGPPRDELTGLAATLDGLLARIAASRRHEQRFAAEMAHELRTPLAGLRLQAELALAAEGPGAAAEREAALEAVVAQATRLGETIDALLAVARREIDPSEGSVDVAEIAGELDGLEVHAPVGGVPLAEGDPDVVRRALMPLVENARRHARSAVRLELSSDAGRVRVAVRDDGPGLDPALGERAFEPGVRGDDANGGGGLGLPLARRLARSCGGDVVAGAGPGGCFVLELPALGPADGEPDA